jgi:flagellar hook protein FlgE
MTATLDSAAAVGTVVPGQVQVYDSMGKSYEATVTYTKAANNDWNYSVSMPDTLSANSSTALGVTTLNYNFGSNGGVLGTVDPGTNLAITGPTASGSTATIAAPVVTAGEALGAAGPPATGYVGDLQAAITAAGITGVTVSSTAGGQLSIVGTGISTSGSVIQDPIASANATGTLAFNANGDLVSPAADVSGISFAGLSDGAKTLNMTWNILGSNGSPTISQVDTTSAVASTTQNGYSSGTYQSFTVGSNGTVTATYSNGQQQNVGQLALANVSNLQGLENLGNSEYATTLASGTAAIGTSGTAGLGTVTDGALEMSNVNISSEFSNLIIAQRAFEASSKAVTTFDTITQETINMIH